MGFQEATEFGLAPVACILMGILTAVGVRAVRDPLVAQVPQVPREEIFALAALAGARIIGVGGAFGLPIGLLT